jgi:hypothetical protein
VGCIEKFNREFHEFFRFVKTQAEKLFVQIR